MAGLLAACTTAGGPVPYATTPLATPDPITAIDAARVYRAGVGDELAVSVFGASEFSGSFTVDDGGSIQMPLIGEVPVLNQTSTEIADRIESRLSARYLRHPDAIVSFRTRTGNRLTVDGSVNTPGNYAFSGPMSLMRVIAMGGGTSENANERRVVVFRQINGQRHAAAFDLRMIREAQAPDPEIYANDIVYVDGARTRQLFRDFLQAVPLIAIFRPF